MAYPKSAYHILLLLMFLTLNGCHIVALPVSYAGAVLKDGWWHVSGDVIDESGKQLDDVKVVVESGPAEYWVPGTLSTASRGPRQRKEVAKSAPFRIGIYGAGVNVRFSREGYFDEEVSWGNDKDRNAKEVDRLMALGWSVTGSTRSPVFHVKLRHRDPPAHLLNFGWSSSQKDLNQNGRFSFIIDDQGYGPSTPRKDSVHGREDFGRIEINVIHDQSTTTSTSVKSDRHPRISGIEIRAVGEDSGVLIANLPDPRRYRQFMQKAPLNGYLPSCELQGQSVLPVPIRPLCFFFKLQGRYGLAIVDSLGYTKHLSRYYIHFEAYLNPSIGNTSLAR